MIEEMQLRKREEREGRKGKLWKGKMKSCKQRNNKGIINEK